MKTPPSLFWSLKGNVACATHAPAADSDVWQSEGWKEIPRGVPRRDRYRCRTCTVAESSELTSMRRNLVLNVDDRPANLYLRDRVLRENGFMVANATTGTEAMRVARGLHPDLILLDIHLPDVDGRALCERIKRDEELSATRVVLISSTLTSDADQFDGVQYAGADGFIKEPVGPDALVSTLRAVLAAA